MSKQASELVNQSLKLIPASVTGHAVCVPARVPPYHIKILLLWKKTRSSRDAQNKGV